MSREEFLRDFLGALGAEDVVITASDRLSLRGVAIFDKNDPDEQQEFIWNAGEEDVPEEDVGRLVVLLKDEGLLDIDRISLDREKLRDRFNAYYSTAMQADQFEGVLAQLQRIRVDMLDDGQVGDHFLIHA